MIHWNKQRIFHVFILGMFLFVNFSLVLNLFTLASSPTSTQELEKEVVLLDQEVTSLKQKTSEKNAQFEKETIIRNELNMKKEGEFVLQLPIPSNIPTSVSTPEKESTPIYKKWLVILF